MATLWTRTGCEMFMCYLNIYALYMQIVMQAKMINIKPYQLYKNTSKNKHTIGKTFNLDNLIIL